MQPGLSIPEFMQDYSTEAQYETALVASRWPRGFACPACRCRLHTTFQRAGRSHWQCQRCHHQTSMTAGTIFEATKLPLTAWFLAMHLLTQAKNNVAALELMRQLGVSWRTAWRIKHKLAGQGPGSRLVFCIAAAVRHSTGGGDMHAKVPSYLGQTVSLAGISPLDRLVSAALFASIASRLGAGRVQDVTLDLLAYPREAILSLIFRRVLRYPGKSGY